MEKERENLMDPIGQFYLPGYFCPAALIDSRETTQDREKDRDNREIIVPQITRVKVTLKLLVQKKIQTVPNFCNFLVSNS